MKCVCEKEISPGKIRSHIENKCEKFGNSSREDRLSTIVYLLTGKSLKEVKFIIKENYIHSECSISDLVLILKISRGLCEDLLSFFKIEKRGFKQSATKNRLEKIEKTSLKRFGVSNISKLEKTKEKKIRTSIEKYGVDNVFQSSWFKDYQKEIMMERYGAGSLPNRFGKKTEWWSQFSKSERSEMTKKWREGSKIWWANLSEEEKEFQIQRRFETMIEKNYPENFQSSLEKRIKERLEYLKIDFQQQFFISRKSFDFFIPEEKIVIEINGDYWHANPEIFSSNDVLLFPSGPLLAKEVWERDEKKKELALKYNFKFQVLWESLIKKLSNEQLDYELQKLFINNYCTFENSSV